MDMPKRKMSRKRAGGHPLNLHFVYLLACVSLMLFLAGCESSGQNRMIFYGGDIITMSDTLAAMSFTDVSIYFSPVLWL
jgi:hypothetical protein